MQTNGLFAQVNDAIRQLATQGPATETWEFVCECPNTACHALVSLTLLEFDERRSASPSVPVLAAEHVSQGRVG